MIIGGSYLVWGRLSDIKACFVAVGAAVSLKTGSVSKTDVPVSQLDTTTWKTGSRLKITLLTENKRRY